MFERIKIEKINDRIWLMNDNDEATGYLVTGTEKALVIDTMNGYEDVRKLAETLTDLPIMAVNTHGHPDHVYGDVYFEEVYIHPEDQALAEQYMSLPEFKKEMKRRGLKMPRLLSVREVIDGQDEGDMPYEWYGGLATAHPYGPEPRRIVYRRERLGKK